MKPHRVFFLLFVSSAIHVFTGCGSSTKHEFQRALGVEETVASEFAKYLAGEGHAQGPVLVLTLPDPGPRAREAQSRRLKGFRAGLGSSRVVEVPISDPDDERLFHVQNDYVPVVLLREAFAAHPGATAAISLVGFPYMDGLEPLPVPLYLFGVSHQDLARQAVDQRWAGAVVYSRGATDAPSRATSPIPPEVLDSYSMETRR